MMNNEYILDEHFYLWHEKAWGEFYQKKLLAYVDEIAEVRTSHRAMEVGLAKANIKIFELEKENEKLRNSSPEKPNQENFHLNDILSLRKEIESLELRRTESLKLINAFVTNHGILNETERDLLLKIVEAI